MDSTLDSAEDLPVDSSVDPSPDSMAGPDEDRDPPVASPPRRTDRAPERTPIRRKLPKNLLRPVPPEEPTAKDESALRLLTLNLAHGRRKGPHQLLQRKHRLQRNLDEVGTLLRSAQPDVVALQEADAPSVWSGNFCHVSHLSDLSGLEHVVHGPHTSFGIGRLQLECGTALLSRHMLGDGKSVAFGQNWRDNKGFVVGAVEVPQWRHRKILVASVHLDFLIPRVRRRQVQRLIETLANRDLPLVLSGDLNCSPLEDPKTLEMLMVELDLHSCDPHLHRPTYPSYRPLRRLDWILASPELRFLSESTPLAPQVSDHLAVIADLAEA